MARLLEVKKHVPKTLMQVDAIVTLLNGSTAVSSMNLFLNIVQSVSNCNCNVIIILI